MMQITYNSRVFKCFTFVFILIIGSIKADLIDFDASKFDHSQHKITNTNTANKPIPNVSSRLGESVLLKCGESEHELLKQLESSSASSSPPVLVNWFKHYSATRRSDKPIYAKYLANNIDYAPHISRDYENRLHVSDKIDLNITSLKAVDEALYECRLILFDKAYADSQLGSMYYLQVHMAPEFEYPNEEIVYFKPNVPIRLYCYAKGKPQPTITWYKNGRRLEANTSVLQETFSGGEVGGGDMHEYRCKAENPVGQIEHTVRVIRSGSLFFTEPFKNLTVMEGTILNWPCLAQSNAEITYKWFKDSVSVQSHLFRWSDRGALFQDGMLYLLETYRNDSGLYECHAYTANKRIDTSAYLNVLYGPEIVPFPSPFYTFEGTQSVVIDCVIKSNPSVIALEWFKDKYLLSNTNKYQILANNSLLIRNVKKSDRGNYYCVCNNTIKKTASPLVKLEVFDSKTSEMATVLNAFAHESIRLPCDTLVFEGGSGESSSPSSSSKIKWLKINSVLASNRYDIDSNGSLVLANLKPKDSGYFLCLTNEDDVVRRPLFGERLIKLNVLLNKSEGANYAASFEASGQLDSDNNDIIELPPSPEKLEINQTLNGVQVKWKSGKQATNSRNRGAAKIEYFQIYFREINEVKTAAATNAWKITEPIRSDQTSYLIDDADLVEHRPYEAHIVSFSQHSKSSPSETVKFRYSPRSAYQKSFDFFDDQNQLDLLSSSNNNINNNNQPLIFKNLINVSQLDIVFIAVFVILLFVLMVCVIACIVYRRSTKKCAAKNSKKVEVDEWGFQSSSAATATFLSSSSSSSDKSLNAYSSTQPSQQAKILRNSAIDNGGGVELMHPSNKRVEFKEDDDNDDDEDYNYLISSNEYNNNNINHNSQYLHHHYQQQNQYYSSHHGRTIRRKSLVDESLSRPTTIDESVNHEGDEDDDEDDIVERVGIEIDDDYYYHAKSSSAARRIGMGGMSANKQRYKLSSSNNSSSSSQKKSSSAASSDSSPTSETATNKSNKMLTMVSNSNNTTTTSGVTSESASNSLIHSSDDTNDEAANNSNNHHPKKPPRAANNTLDNNNLTTIKYNAKTNKVATTCNKKLVLISANQNSSKKPPSGKQVEYIVVKNNAKSPPPTKYTDEESENNSFLEHSDEINDVSIDVDCSKQIAPPNKDSDSSVASTSSSSASNPPSSTLSPVKYFSSDPQQQPLPFPTSHFLTFQLRNNEKSQQAKQQQLGKLNSSSSLTMVSKMPSTSYAYIEANENEITNNDTLGSITPTMTNNTDTIRIILSSSANNPTSSLSSTSSGCSSLENNNNANKYQSSSSSSHYHQYYQPSIRRSSAKTAWPSSPSSNKDYITSSQSQQQPQYVKYQNYSTYRPTVKATANLNGNDSNHSSSNKRTSKIDYV